MPKMPRYKGVRQGHWGSWVSEILHPLLKTRLMSVPTARTNFPLNGGSTRSCLSPTLSARLEKCCSAGSSSSSSQAAAAAGGHGGVARQDDEAEAWTRGDGEEYMEEMIQELTFYGSIEIVQPSD